MELYDAQGRRISLSALGLKALRLEVQPPAYETTLEETEGPGAEIVSRRLTPRNMTAFFWLEKKDGQTLRDARNALFAYLGSLGVFYISDTPGRRWRVYTDEWNLEPINAHTLAIDIPLIAAAGVSESTNLVTRRYEEFPAVFRNNGSWPIDPRQFGELRISYSGASENLEVLNETNGTRWKVVGSTLDSDTLALQGVKRIRNGAPLLGQTNRELITLAPGANVLRVTGGAGVLEIQTRQYML